MDKNFEKIEHLLFEKSYEDLSAEEKKLVDQHMGTGLYGDIRSLGKTPQFQSAKLEARLAEAYKEHYRNGNMGKNRFSYLTVAALIVGLCFASSILTWYTFSTQMTPKFINVPEIIVLRDTIYVPIPEKVEIQKVKPENKKTNVPKRRVSKPEHKVIFASTNDSAELYPDKELPSLVNLAVTGNEGSPNDEDTILTKALIRIY